MPKTKEEPEDPKRPHKKVPKKKTTVPVKPEDIKPPEGDSPEEAKKKEMPMEGELLKGVRYEIRKPMRFQKHSTEHKFTVIFTEDTQISKFAIDYLPNKGDMKKLYDNRKAGKPVGVRN